MIEIVEAKLSHFLELENTFETCPMSYSKEWTVIVFFHIFSS